VTRDTPVLGWSCRLGGQTEGKERGRADYCREGDDQGSFIRCGSEGLQTRVPARKRLGPCTFTTNRENNRISAGPGQPGGGVQGPGNFEPRGRSRTCEARHCWAMQWVRATGCAPSGRALSPVFDAVQSRAPNQNDSKRSSVGREGNKMAMRLFGEILGAFTRMYGPQVGTRRSGRAEQGSQKRSTGDKPMISLHPRVFCRAMHTGNQLEALPGDGERTPVAHFRRLIRRGWGVAGRGQHATTDFPGAIFGWTGFGAFDPDPARGGTLGIQRGRGGWCAR